MYVKPAAGLSIRDPDRRDRLPPEGREVPETSYWRRRLAEKSVLRAAAAPAAMAGPADPPARPPVIPSKE